MEKYGNYELLYIVHPDLESSIDKVTDKIKTSIEKRGGKINYEENWGKRKLAYEIKKNDVGIYVLWFFAAPKKSIAKIEKEIRLTEEIIRYLILTIEEPKKASKTRTKTEPKRETEKTKEEKPETKESEKARMKKIDEKLGELLGEEDNKKKPKKKEA
ncbi:30S ribosomal protein S6 [Patescibacteria group bacterium]|nr:30S ribosomal protein S6 [Patescibacteria group bacterium]